MGKFHKLNEIRYFYIGFIITLSNVLLFAGQVNAGSTESLKLVKIENPSIAKKNYKMINYFPLNCGDYREYTDKILDTNFS
jgi:hypothetical protein